MIIEEGHIIILFYRTIYIKRYIGEKCCGNGMSRHDRTNRR